MDLPPDFKDRLEELARAKAEFLVVGGYAVAFHGRPRATKDIDLLLPGGDENLARVASALGAFGAPANVIAAVANMGLEDVVYLGVAPLRIDLLRRIDGVEAAHVFARAVDAEVAGVRFKVIARDDLIANKRAAGRPQDLIDADVLERAGTRR